MLIWDNYYDFVSDFCIFSFVGHELGKMKNVEDFYQ